METERERERERMLQYRTLIKTIPGQERQTGLGRAFVNTNSIRSSVITDQASTGTATLHFAHSTLLRELQQPCALSLSNDDNPLKI